MYKILKSLVVSMTLIGATTSSYVSAETIRLVGPTGETIPAPQYSEQIQKAKPEVAPKVSGDPARYYGPTAKSETLWSIASKVRPSNQVSIQQTIYALYQLNPNAFESNNIHLLIPNSQLRIPSLAQVVASDTVQATTILKAHKARLEKTQLKTTATKTASDKTVSSKLKTPSQTANEKPTSANKIAEKSAPSTASKQASSVNDKQMQLAAAQQQAAKLAEKLQQKLTVSESELLSLEERNHQLRLMLAEVQNEVESLKKEVSNEERIRAEVEKQLNEEKRRQEELQRLAPGQLDLMLANPWIVAALAIIPALFVGLLIFMFKGKRKAVKISEQNAEQEPASSSKAPVVIGAAAGAAALTAEADDFDDDIFADLDELDVDENSSEPKLDDSQDDIFADLNDSDLNFNLDDGDSDPFASIDEQGDLNVDYVDLESSSNGISVNGADKALGLEEMEQALSDVSVSTEETAIPQGIALEESDPVSQQDLDDLFSEISEPGLDSEHADPELMLDDDLDMPSFGQEDMDELLSETDFNLGDDDLDLSSESEEEARSIQPETLDNDDIDDLFSQFASDAESQADNAKPHHEEAVLLDEMLEEGDFELSDLEDSELLLDEVLAESNAVEASADTLGLNTETDLDSQADGAFDELIGADEDELQDIGLAEDSTELLDELLMEPAFSAKASADEQSVELDPFSGTELLADDVSDDSDVVEDRDAIEGGDAFKESHNNDQVSASDIDELIQSSSLMGHEGEPAVSGFEPNEMQRNDEADTSVAHSEDIDLPVIEPTVQQTEVSLADDGHTAEVDSDVPLNNIGSASEIDESESEALPESELDEINELTEPSHYDSESVTPSDDDTHDIDDGELDVESTVQADVGVEENVESTLEEATELVDNSDLASSDTMLEPEDSTSEDFETDSGLLAYENNVIEPASVDASTHREDEALASEPVAPLIKESDAIDELTVSTEQIQAPGEFNFEPKIEGSEDHWHQSDDRDETSETELAQMVANEFGVPQDEDWFVDEELNDQVAAPVSEDLNADDEPQVPAASDNLNATNFDDSLLAEYGEQEALDDALLEEGNVVEGALPDGQDDQPLELSDDDLPEYSEEDALADMGVESDAGDDIDYRASEVNDNDDEQAKHQIPPIGEPIGEPLNHSEIDALADAFTMVDTSAYEQESQLIELLDESDNSPSFSNISRVDADMAHSAGMDIDTMLEGSNSVDAGEDWNGFKLTQEQQASISTEIPEDEAEIWQGEEIKGLSEPADEDWSTQDDLADFDPKANQYMTIDELMNQADDKEPSNPDDEELMLDVGLDEFPDVIGPVSDVDVDSGAEAAGKLDLAKIYMEMNDIAGAQKLLEQAASQGNEPIANEAKQLLEQLST
ncbi:hypothetical protein LNL84_01405 [Vibrio sp. ZSDZ34]|uniref:AAA family ATPase n=1 Tax=Vibrio gelatinilyticus TaxID=2893468 RepID=A0A9X1W759_9VIBR|nr:FimV/HubP family polar landmark protein [Vibrio gelatinilyticus]MCJ2375487.1 hypothetical protein [Vibrio gelatinilyticus]